MLPEYVKEADLVHLMRRDLGEGVNTGKWTKFICPWCRHLQRKQIKTFLLATNEGDRGIYFCKFCNRRGDALSWLKDYRRMSTEDALRFLKTTPIRNARSAVPTAEP